MVIAHGVQKILVDVAKLCSRSAGNLARDLDSHFSQEMHQLSRETDERQRQDESMRTWREPRWREIKSACHRLQRVLDPQYEPQPRPDMPPDLLQNSLPDLRPDLLPDSLPGLHSDPLPDLYPEVGEQQEQAEQHEQLDLQNREEAVNEAMERMRLNVLEREIALTYLQLPADQVQAAAPNFEMLPRDTPLDLLWDEWFSAQQDRPSIWSLNMNHRNWRRGWSAVLRNHYMLKRRIIYATLDEIRRANGPIVLPLGKQR